VIISEHSSIPPNLHIGEMEKWRNGEMEIWVYTPLPAFAYHTLKNPLRDIANCKNISTFVTK